jgi:predicted esterase
MGIEGLFGFSRGPIIALWVLTLLSGLLGIIGVTDALIAFFRGIAVKGWSSIIIISGFSGCAILGALAVIATYIERIHRIVLHRPLYLVRETTCNGPTSFNKD